MFSVLLQYDRTFYLTHSVILFIKETNSKDSVDFQKPLFVYYCDSTALPLRYKMQNVTLSMENPELKYYTRKLNLQYCVIGRYVFRQDTCFRIYVRMCV